MTDAEARASEPTFAELHETVDLIGRPGPVEGSRYTAELVLHQILLRLERLEHAGGLPEVPLKAPRVSVPHDEPLSHGDDST